MFAESVLTAGDQVLFINRISYHKPDNLVMARIMETIPDGILFLTRTIPIMVVPIQQPAQNVMLLQKPAYQSIMVVKLFPDADLGLSFGLFSSH